MKIKKIGIEIEGGWKKHPPEKIYFDGSVVSSSEFKMGEICSRPLQHRQIEKWLKKNYPVFTHESCGLHIHISLKKNLWYSQLMTRKFYNFFLSEIEKWGKEKDIFQDSPFWKRLAGDNRFCQKRFQAERQIEKTEKNSIRYTHLNYCFAMHSTLECRLFPTFKKIEIAYSAVEKFIEIVETFLAQQKREKKIECTLKDEEEEETIKISDCIEAEEEKICV